MTRGTLLHTYTWSGWNRELRNVLPRFYSKVQSYYTSLNTRLDDETVACWWLFWGDCSRCIL